MLAGSMPKAVTASALVDTATKRRLMLVGRAVLQKTRRAALRVGEGFLGGEALVTTNSVLRRSKRRSRPLSRPASTLAHKMRAQSRWPMGRRASHTSSRAEVRATGCRC